MDKNKINQVMVLDAAYTDGSLPGVIDEIFKTFDLDVCDKSVLVKPNMLSGEPPEKGSLCSYQLCSTSALSKLGNS